MPNTVQLKKNGQPVFPVTDVSLVMGLAGRPLMDAVYAWDGTGTPDITKIPAGVTVEYNTTTYTGTLAASADTTARFYLVPSTTVPGEYDRYLTDAVSGSYSWKSAGTTAIPTPSIVDNLESTDPTKALSAKQGKVLNEELGELEAKVTEIEDKIEYELDNTFSVTESVESLRLSRAVSLPFTGKCSIVMSVISGTDTGNYCIYRNINGSIGASLSETVPFGTPVTVDIPEGDSGVWLFTVDNSISLPRTYKAEFSHIENGVSERVSLLDAEIARVESETKASQETLSNNVLQVFAERQVTVASAGNRSISFSVKPGMNIRFLAEMVSGDGTSYYVYHTSVTSANRIFDVPVGKLTASYTVPQGIDTIIVFPLIYGAGVVYKVTLYNSLSNKWYTDQLTDANTLPFITNYTATTFEVDLVVSESAQYILPATSDGFENKEGDIYIRFNSCTAIFNNYGLRFKSTDNATFDIYYKELGLSLIKVFSGKKLANFYVRGGSIESPGHISITIYSAPDQAVDFSRPLKGKKIACFGDSITQFGDQTKIKRYSDYLSTLSEAETYNYGVGGTRLALRSTPTTTPVDNQECVAAFEIVSLVISWATNNYDIQDAAIASGLLTQDQQTLYETKLALLKANPIAGFDIVTIFGGTNDYTGGSTIGNADAGNTNKGTIYGAINSMVSAILTAKPTMKIYFFSPIIRMFEQTVSLATSSDVFVAPSAPEGKTLPEFCEVIADAVKLNHCPFCDWYWSLGWNIYNFTEYFANDYTHPYNGFIYLAEKMYEFLLSN